MSFKTLEGKGKAIAFMFLWLLVTGIFYSIFSLESLDLNNRLIWCIMGLIGIIIVGECT